MHPINLSLIIFAIQFAYSLECVEAPHIAMSPDILKDITSMRDTSVRVKRVAAKELKKNADTFGKDNNLYDTLVSYTLDNLYTHYYLKDNEGFEWLAKFQGSEMPAICRRFRSEKNYELRRALIMSLEGKKFPLAGQILKAGFNDTDSTIVVESIRVYGENGFDDAFSTLSSLLDSGNVLKKVGAIRGLSYFKNTSSAKLLLDKVLLEKNAGLPHDFSLVPVNLMSVSAVYIIDTTTPNQGESLHDEAFFSIEQITGERTERKIANVKAWLRKKNGDSKKSGRKKASG